MDLLNGHHIVRSEPASNALFLKIGVEAAVLRRPPLAGFGLTGRRRTENNRLGGVLEIAI